MMTALTRTALAALVLLAPALPSAAQTPSQTYHEKCAICHDGGGGGAPRIGNRAEWAGRLEQGRAVLHENTLKGIPGTAMVAKGGFPELSDAAVIAAVDFMLTTVGVRPGDPLPATRKVAIVAAKPAAPAQPVDDGTLAANVRSAIAREKDIVLSGMKIAAASGVVTLAGVVDTGDQIKRAAAAAAAVPGVARVENNLQTKGMFAWD